VLQADEELYHSHIQVIGRLLQALKTADDQTNGSGALPPEQFTAVLTQFFPLKQTEYIARLAQAAATELNVTSDDFLLYGNLFTEVGFDIVAVSFFCHSRFEILSIYTSDNNSSTRKYYDIILIQPSH